MCTFKTPYAVLKFSRAPQNPSDGTKVPMGVRLEFLP
jgi:hypothetical protein